MVCTLNRLMRKCTALLHASLLPVQTGTSAWNCEVGMRFDAIYNTRPSGY